jgi:hypothetical protein
MFWRVAGFTQPSPIETILDKENFTLEELLDEDDLIQVPRRTRAALGTAWPWEMHALYTVCDRMQSTAVLQRVWWHACDKPITASKVCEAITERLGPAFGGSVPPVCPLIVIRRHGLMRGKRATGRKSAHASSAMQECKALNGRLINFLRERKTVEALLRYLVQDPDQPGGTPTSDADSKQRFKYPYAACEVSFVVGSDLSAGSLRLDAGRLTLPCCGSAVSAQMNPTWTASQLKPTDRLETVWAISASVVQLPASVLTVTAWVPAQRQPLK